MIKVIKSVILKAGVIYESIAVHFIVSSVSKFIHLKDKYLGHDGSFNTDLYKLSLPKPKLKEVMGHMRPIEGVATPLVLLIPTKHCRTFLRCSV